MENGVLPRGEVGRILGLIALLTRRELAGRYRSSFLGVLWSLGVPALMLAVYTFVFGVVFQHRWGEQVPNQSEFALILFLGLIVFWLFSDCIGAAPGLIPMHATFVHKVVFPLEILPCVLVSASLFHGALRLGVFLVAYVAILGPPPATILLLPVVLLPLVVLTLGLCWFLSSTAVFVRDVQEVVSVALTGALFLSPVFYPASELPTAFRWLLFANPISFPVEQIRSVTFWGQAPDWAGLALYSALSGAVAWLGFAWFARTRKGFADVV
jgi:lipopolysaccharide transport system permease protein